MVLVLSLLAASVSGADAPAPRAPNITELLNQRKQQQIEAAKGTATFYGFQFTNQLAASGITFTQRIVDDAGKSWIPVHYDHGTAVAVADVDGDGLLDVYFVNQVGSSQLWRNLGQGKFEDITARAGVGLEDRIGVAASFADIDNDGDPDLFVTTVRTGNVLFENLGGGRFRDISKEAGVDYVGHSSGAVFFDFDNDGRLDLFVANIGVYTSNEKGRGGFYRGLPDAFLGHRKPERTEGSILYRNLGGRKFRDASAEAGLQDKGWAGDASFADLNQDGYPDLYVLNMQGDDHYYENVQGRRFVEKTAACFPKTPWGAMGLKFFDYNLDGLVDLFITDMHSDMTDLQTRTYKNSMNARFEKQKSEAYCGQDWVGSYLERADKNIFGNAFYQNLGHGKFVEVSDKLGVETYWPWGVTVVDLNADGYEDIFVTAGMGYPFRYGINSLLLNDQGRRFFDAEFLVGVEPRRGGRTEKTAFVLDCFGADRGNPLCAGQSGRVRFMGALSSRSSAAFDLDDDGDLDLITNEMNDQPQVLISNLAQEKRIHYLKIRLVGTTSNRDGLGAVVTAHSGGRVLLRSHDGKSGYISQSSMPLYFGLGEATNIDRIEVRWPSGKKQDLTNNIPVNTLLTIREGREGEGVK